MIIKHTNGTSAPDAVTAGIPRESNQTIAVDTVSAITHVHQGLPMTANGRLAVDIDGTIDYIGAGGQGFTSAGRLFISTAGPLRGLGGVNYGDDYPPATSWYPPA